MPPEALFLVVAFVFIFGASMFALLYFAFRTTEPYHYPKHWEKERQKAIEKFKDDVFLEALQKDAAARSHDLTQWVNNPFKGK